MELNNIKYYFIKKDLERGGNDMLVPPYMIETKYYIKEIEETDRYTAYGNFLDRFRGCDGEGKGRKLQEYIIKDKPIDSNKYPIELVVIAATVEVLAKERNMKIPSWVYDGDCYLEEAYYAGAKIPEYRKLLEDTAIPEFKKRKLYLGDNCMSRA